MELHPLYTHCSAEGFCWDVLEWCPLAPFQNYFVCGAYNYNNINHNNSDSNALVVKTQQRFGAIYLFSICARDGLKSEQLLHTTGILDLKWCSRIVHSSILLGAVTATNQLIIYQMQRNAHKLQQIIASHQLVKEDNTLLLALDWCDNKSSSTDADCKIVCSSSKGHIHVFRLTANCHQLELMVTYSNAHQFEVWSCCFASWNENVIFSGGDDNRMLQFDLRVSGNHPVNSIECHQAGVTCIMCRHSPKDVLTTGSYDSFVRFWDVKALKEPVSCKKMPGNPWTIKWDPFNSDILGVACMEAGLQIFNRNKSNHLENDDDEGIIDNRTLHRSLTYGLDWCYIQNLDVFNKFQRNCCRLIGTCSFYDHILCISGLSSLE